MLIIAMFSRGDASSVLPNRASNSRRLRGGFEVGRLMKMIPEGPEYFLAIIASR
jgi:hypothetical protein